MLLKSQARSHGDVAGEVELLITHRNPKLLRAVVLSPCCLLESPVELYKILLCGPTPEILNVCKPGHRTVKSQ